MGSPHSKEHAKVRASLRTQTHRYWYPHMGASAPCLPPRGGGRTGCAPPPWRACGTWGPHNPLFPAGRRSTVRRFAAALTAVLSPNSTGHQSSPLYPQATTQVIRALPSPHNSPQQGECPLLLMPKNGF